MPDIPNECYVLALLKAGFSPKVKALQYGVPLVVPFDYADQLGAAAAAGKRLNLHTEAEAIWRRLKGE